MTNGVEQIVRVLFVLAAVAVVTCPAGAQVVCLGASNTAGKGVSQQDAYPAQLEAMLRARHYDGRVANAGVSGDTTWGMLNRLETAVPAGTQIVILQPGGNDERHGVASWRDANISQIVERLTLGAAAKAGVRLIVWSATQGPKVRRLFARGRQIRTIGPAKAAIAALAG